MYKFLVRPLLFKFPPECAHTFATNMLAALLAIPGVKLMLRSMYCVDDKNLERELFGLHFKNPVGLAAGFDKEASMYNNLSHLGFGFIEVGTITPLGQPGNPKPRMFRLPQDKGLINRMGFNNMGLDEAITNLKKRKTDIIIGGNIGKNKNTANEQAVDDYKKCFEGLFPYVDYFVVNVSSPNTPNLRDLQDKKPLTEILNGLQELNATKEKRKAILLKIAPDLTNAQLDDIIDIVAQTKIDGIIATNTTISRKGLKTEGSVSKEQGGLSGFPVRKRSTEVIKYLHETSKGAFPIIGVGGISSAADAQEKLAAGASLIQVYTGFIYEGPGLVRKICRGLIL